MSDEPGSIQSIQEFCNKFHSTSNSIEQTLKEFNNDSSIEFSVWAEEQFSRIKVLKDDLSNSTHFLPQYDIEKSKNKITLLEHLLEDVRKKYQPKKFSFRKLSKKHDSDKVIENQNKLEVRDSKFSLESHTKDDSFTFREIKGETIIIDRSIYGDNKDFTFNQIENCTIYITTITNALRIKGMKNCTLCAGPTNGSVFIDQSFDSTFYIASKQLRFFDSHRIIAYIYTTSIVTIEKCDSLIFGPYCFEYENSDQHFKVSNSFFLL